MEGSLWKMKSSLTGTTWKKHWVHADVTTIKQWHSRTKPSANEKPKYVLDLSHCEIEDNQSRKYCFKISDQANRTVLLLAVDDFDEYEKWLKILFHKRNAAAAAAEPSEQSADNENNSDYQKSVVNVEEEEFSVVEEEEAEDFVLTYFQTHDVTKVRKYMN